MLENQVKDANFKSLAFCARKFMFSRFDTRQRDRGMKYSHKIKKSTVAVGLSMYQLHKLNMVKKLEWHPTELKNVFEG